MTRSSGKEININISCPKQNKTLTLIISRKIAHFGQRVSVLSSRPGQSSRLFQAAREDLRWVCAKPLTRTKSFVISVNHRRTIECIAAIRPKSASVGVCRLRIVKCSLEFIRRNTRRDSHRAKIFYEDPERENKDEGAIEFEGADCKRRWSHWLIHEEHSNRFHHSITTFCSCSLHQIIIRSAASIFQGIFVSFSWKKKH